jgi:hypothetical protein
MSSAASSAAWALKPVKTGPRPEVGLASRAGVDPAAHHALQAPERATMSANSGSAATETGVRRRRRLGRGAGPRCGSASKQGNGQGDAAGHGEPR